MSAPVLPGMFDPPVSDIATARFDGSDYEPAQDNARLSGQIRRIYGLMSDGQWRTLREVEEVTGDPQSSVSAQLRHLRKVRFGAHVIEKRPRGDRAAGLFEYRLKTS